MGSLSTGYILAIVFGSILLISILGYLIYRSVFKKNNYISLNQIEQFIKSNPQYRDTIANYAKKNTVIDTSSQKKEINTSSDVLSKDKELNQVFKDSQTTPVR